MPDSTISLLRDLIAIDSVNPSLVPGANGENEIGGAIATKLHTGGLDVQIQQVAPGRANVVGVLDGKQKGRSLMLCGHMDTVGVAGMAGLLYGRGNPGPRFLDFTGGVKPHLLSKVDNHLGAQTTVHYRPSTEDYLRDAVDRRVRQCRRRSARQFLESRCRRRRRTDRHEDRCGA